MCCWSSLGPFVAIETSAQLACAVVTKNPIEPTKHESLSPISLSVSLGSVTGPGFRRIRKMNRRDWAEYQAQLAPIIQNPNCECVRKRGRTVFIGRDFQNDLPLSFSAQTMSSQSDAQYDISQRGGGPEVLSSLHLGQPCRHADDESEG